MLHQLLPPNRKEAPRKKRRGLKRYFRKVIARAEAASLDLDETSWFDYMHEHPDWYGYGNLGCRMRVRHLEALAIVFRRYAEHLKTWSKPYQLWIYLDARDAAYDAVYVHSPNPHGDDFPWVPDDTVWGIAEVSRHFEKLLPGYRLRAGRYGNADAFVQPDILFIAKDRLGIYREDGPLRGAPDLVVEVLSPATAQRDQATKRALYAQAGVKVYWLVNPDERSITRISFPTGVETAYRLGDTLSEPVLPGFAIPVDELLHLD
ncbi:MAG: hypothetical protein K0R39_3520 [Symbiobacteriaceae bacterium]|jgi:hypothetical protein|nr:hypothetical protein [Symbiobacteriaceae bacterium]